MIVRSDDGVEGCASGDALPDRELLERLLVGVDPLRTEVVREVLRDGRLPPRPALDASRPPSGISSAGRSTCRCWQLLGGRSERLVAYASSGELLDAGRARRARRRAARRRYPRREAALPPRRLARRRRRRRGGARRGRRRSSS